MRVRGSGPSGPKKRRVSHFRVVFALAVFFLVIFSVLTSWIIDMRIAPVIEAWARQRAINLATRAISNAVQEMMADRLDAMDFVTLERGENNRIEAVKINNGAINLVVSEMTTRIQDSLNVTAEDILEVPIGQIFGIKFLAGWGPTIPVRILPVGAVDTIPRTKFMAQGINQTLHRVYLDVRTSVRVVVPFAKTEVPVRSEVPLAETIVAGKVPEVVVNFLNQVPDLRELESLQIQDQRLQ